MHWTAVTAAATIPADTPFETDTPCTASLSSSAREKGVMARSEDDRETEHEATEGRGAAEGETPQQTMPDTAAAGAGVARGEAETAAVIAGCTSVHRHVTSPFSTFFLSTTVSS